MLRRLAFLFLLSLALVGARPAWSQDFSRFDMAFGYTNYGVNDIREGSLQLGFPIPEARRTHGFSMQTDINLTRWFTFEYALGAFGQNNDVTLLTNTFGAKLVARDVVDGRVSPYVSAGGGVGSFMSDRSYYSLGSTSALRYAGGIDLNMSSGTALRLEAGRMRLGDNLGRAGGQSDLSVTIGIVISLGP